MTRETVAVGNKLKSVFWQVRSHSPKHRQSQLPKAESGKLFNFHSLMEEVVGFMRRHPGARMLSVGSGPGGVELEFARQLVGHSYEIVCLDINPHLMELGAERAAAESLNVHFEAGDFNHLTLEPEQYDLIFCHASLHHVINLEHLFYEMNRSLKPHGEVVVVDIVTRNGYLMWEETLSTVRALWQALPQKFKFNHTGYAEVRYDEEYENRDYTDETMECIRSQDILRLLNEYFTCQVYVPSTTLARRFLDTMYGPNYDPAQPLDRHLMEFLWELDVHYLETGMLKPESMFGVYGKGAERPRPMKYSEQEQPEPVATNTAAVPEPAAIEAASAATRQPPVTETAPAPIQTTHAELTQRLLIEGEWDQLRDSVSAVQAQVTPPLLTEGEWQELRHLLWVWQRLRHHSFWRMLRRFVR
jgi:ubiquinone/menaquinone biosynthesis C-methylase UbiE